MSSVSVKRMSVKINSFLYGKVIENSVIFFVSYLGDLIVIFGVLKIDLVVCCRIKFIFYVVKRLLSGWLYNCLIIIFLMIILISVVIVNVMMIVIKK